MVMILAGHPAYMIIYFAQVGALTHTQGAYLRRLRIRSRLFAFQVDCIHAHQTRSLA